MWPRRTTVAAFFAAGLLVWGCAACAQVVTLTFDDLPVGPLLRRAFQNKKVVIIGGVRSPVTVGLEVVDCEAGWMHKGYLTKAAGCKRLLRITTNAVETHENIGICGVTELAAYGPAYQCALRNYGKQNPAYDSLPNGYVPFENVYIKYRTDTDSWRLNALVYEEGSHVYDRCEGAAMPRTHTSPVFRTTYTYSAGNAGMWDLSSSIACARGDGAFSFSINRAAVAEVEEILIESITITLDGRVSPPRPPAPPPSPPLPPAAPRPPPSPPVPPGFVELAFDSLPVGLLRRDAFKDQKISIQGGAGTSFPRLDRWSIVDCAAGWESNGVRYTAANCNRLLRIQANSLLGQPFISVCQMMDRDYWCEPLNDAGVEPEGARYISNVVVRYRTFGRTFTFVPKFYHSEDRTYSVCSESRRLPTFPPTHPPPSPDTTHFHYTAESNTVSAEAVFNLSICRGITGRPTEITLGAADFPFENDEEILIESILVDLRLSAPAPPPPVQPANFPSWYEPPNAPSPPRPRSSPPPPDREPQASPPPSPAMPGRPLAPGAPGSPGLPPWEPAAPPPPPPSSPPVPWVWAAECADTHPNCEIWATTDQCTLNPGYMLYNCKTACRVPLCVGTDDPDAPCRDAHPTCPAWAFSGECERTSDYMKVNCQLSCNTCSLVAGTPGMPWAPPAKATPEPAPSPVYDTTSPWYGAMPPPYYGPLPSPPTYSPGYYAPSPAPSYASPAPSPVPAHGSGDAPSNGGNSDSEAHRMMSEDRESEADDDQRGVDDVDGVIHVMVESSGGGGVVRRLMRARR